MEINYLALEKIDEWLHRQVKANYTLEQAACIQEEVSAQLPEDLETDACDGIVSIFGVEKVNKMTDNYFVLQLVYVSKVLSGLSGQDDKNLTEKDRSNLEAVIKSGKTAMAFAEGMDPLFPLTDDSISEHVKRTYPTAQDFVGYLVSSMGVVFHEIVRHHEPAPEGSSFAEDINKLQRYTELVADSTVKASERFMPKVMEMILPELYQE